MMIMVILMLIYDLKLEPMPEMSSLLKILLFFHVFFGKRILEIMENKMSSELFSPLKG